MHAVRSGEAIAAVYIPREPRARHRGGQAAADRHLLQQAVSSRPATSPPARCSAAVSAGDGRSADAARRSAGFTPGPLVVEQYVLTNPALNYAQFLLRAILPTVLHVVIAIAAGYAVGSEFGSRNMREWLATAGGDPAHGAGRQARALFRHLPADDGRGRDHHSRRLRGAVPRRPGADRGRRLPADRRLSVASARSSSCSSRNLAFGLSLTGIICSPAFGFAGVGFPVLAHERFRPRLGLAAAAALVHPDPVRPGRARRAGRRFGPSLHHPRRHWPSSFSASRGSACVRRRQARRRTSRRRPRTGPARLGIVRRLRRRIWPRARRPRRLRPDRPGAPHLRRVLSAALSRAAHPRHADRRRRRRFLRGQPTTHPGA